jgi:hypothetical protein
MRPWFRFLSYGLGGFLFVFAVIAAVLFRDLLCSMELAGIGTVWMGLAWRHRHANP